jgi:hypothetical protein
MLMTEEAASRFEELQQRVPVPHTSEERRKIEIHPPADQQVDFQKAHAVVMLDPHADFSLQAVSHAEATDRFWAASLPTEREHISAEWVSDLLDRPVYVLRRGASPQAAAAALDDLAASLR